MEKMSRTILHVDMNNFYASVECLYRPEIRNHPVAVAGDPLNRHGIILAKNMIAKKMGVKTGEAIWEAKQKAPGLITVPPDFQKYLRFSRLAEKYYMIIQTRLKPLGWMKIGQMSQALSGCSVLVMILLKKYASELKMNWALR